MILINFIVFILTFIYCCHGNPIIFLGQTPFQCYVSGSQDIELFLYQLYAVSGSSLEPVLAEYTIVSGNDLRLFVINSTNGIIRSALPLSVSDHTLLVQASSSSGSTTMASLSIHILPSLHDSLLEHSNYNLSISEDIRVGTRISIIRVFSSVQATVSLGGDSRGDFMLNPLNGELSIARPLDREAIQVYRIDILVQDGTGGQDNGAALVVMVIDVNDETPSFQKSFCNVTIDEGTLPNSTVTMVTAVDGDDGTNGHIMYSLSGDANAMSTFHIGPTTGTIYNLITLDYEVHRQYQLIITARDHGSVPRSSNTSVLIILRNLDDSCPQFSSSMYEVERTTNQLENSSPLELLQVEAFDPDNISLVMYAIQSGDDDNNFQINSTTGVITLLENIHGQFELNVSATDGCLAFTTVTVNLGDVDNEHQPVFNTSSCRVELKEHPANGTHVTMVTATDNDTGSFGRLTYSFLTRSSLFAINATTGEVVTIARPGSYDYESIIGFELGVLATDGGGRQGFCEMWIALIDINDNSPQFIVTAYSVSVSPPYNSTGHFVVQVRANDRDTGGNGNVTYSIEDSVPFTVHPTTGTITVSQSLFSQNYSFQVVARDQGVTQRSSSVSVMVTMPTGQIPVFTNCTNSTYMGTEVMCVYSVTIEESTWGSVGITVATVMSSDNIVVYEALHGTDYRSNSEGTLYIATSGAVLVNSSSVIDYERLSPGPYSIQFLVSAHILPTHTFAIAMVIINVTDIDDSPPQFPSVTLFATVKENAGDNAYVTRVTAHDPDSGSYGQVTYSIHSQEGNNFAINSSNGIVASRRSFDAEVEYEFILIVRAVSNGVEDLASLTISVGDVNDNRPQFNQTVYNISVRESEPVHSNLFHFPITDLDQSDRGKHVFSIIGGNNDGTFSVTRSGDLVLQQLLDYDRSSRHNYFLNVQVSDGIFSHETYISIQIIDVDDEPPVFAPDNYSLMLSEGVAVGTFVVQLIASDTDSPSITYHLTGLANGRLVVSSNGSIHVSSDLDREYLPQLQFFAFAIGGEGCIAVATVTITLTDVNDNAPIWLHPIIVTMIQENVAESTLIATVHATDPDDGRNGMITYHLTDNFDRFLINSTTGELTVIMAFDREQVQLVSVMVTARDNGTPQLSSQVEVLIEILDVNDNSPFFPYPYMFARVCEDAVVGQTVLFIPAADSDTGSNAAVQYILEPGGTNDDHFTVNASTGEVTLARHVDFENPSHRLATLQISLVDMGPPMHSSVSMGMLEIEILDSNDNRPMPSQNSHVISLAENVSVGSTVLTLTSSDRDTGSNAELTYSIVCCSDVFSIITEGIDGLLMIASSLDYETAVVHQLEIIVADNGRPSLYNNISVRINVSDVNDNSPQFNQSIYSTNVAENTNNDPHLIQVSASDVDTGLGGVIDKYAILAGNEEGHFTINATTGVVGLQVREGARLDRETVDQYTLTIIATDKGNPLRLTGSVLVHITVTDIDDHPSFSGYMTIHINALDGRFQAGYLADVYLNDSDSTSVLDGCVATFGNHDILGVADNCSLILLEDDPGEGLYELVVKGNSSSGPVTMTTITVMVKHVDTPGSFLALTLGVSVETYLLQHYTSLPILLAELLNVPNVDVLSILPSNDHSESVDIVFTGEMLPSASHMTQQLFLQRDNFTANDIPLVTIPIDACQDDYCFNLGRCISSSGVTHGRVVTVVHAFVYYSIHLAYELSCNCDYWATGSKCETVFDHCYSNPCNNGGVCKNVILDFECECLDGTSGKECSDGCSNRECLNGGVCVNDALPSYCSCPEDYYGDKCQYQYFVDSNYCTPNPCLNGATCSAGRDGFTCHCLQGYSGLLCELSVVREGGCVSNPCYHNSTCSSDATSGFICACSVGFTGPQCRWPLNECETKPCGDDINTCLPGRYGSYLCRCSTGYTGPNCSLPDLCNPNPCQNGGTCDMVTDGYICQCSTSYTGVNCDDTIDSCTDDKCMHGSSCHNDGLTCDCPLFAAGHYCEVFCPHGNTGERCEQEIDFCQSNDSVCFNGGTCRSTKVGATCTCPPTQFGDHCELSCSDSYCTNGGTCSDLGVCQCDDDFDGPQCKLTTVSFKALPQQPAYRAYDTPQFRSLGTISFQVATRASHGLLLLSIQWSGSEVRDYLSIELVQGGHVSAKMSLGSGTTVAMVMSDVVRLNDGQWHDVMLKVQSKELQLLVDHCIDVDSALLPLLDCHGTAVAPGNYSSLDLGLPLWIGGAPEIEGYSEGIGTDICISNFTVNEELLDLEDYVYELNSIKGCDQLDGCRVNPCVEGTCAVEWEGHQCYVMEPITFAGDGYARYILLDSGVAKRQVAMEIAFYEESISMRIRTDVEQGLLFRMGGANDFAMLELRGGLAVYSIDLGSGVTMVIGGYVSDTVWHTINVHRVGLSVTMAIDDRTTYSTDLQGKDVILDILTNEIYAGGHDQSVLYEGCIDDIRLNDKQLPTNGTNQFASVSFIEASPIRGCVIGGPCFPDPCTEGVCQPVSMDIYRCICSGSACALAVSESTDDPLVVYIGVAGGVLLILIITTTATFVCIYRRYRRQHYGRFSPSKEHHEMYFIEENMGTIGEGHEDGGGEQDIACKGIILRNQGVATSTSEVNAIVVSAKAEADKQLTEVDSLRHFAYECSEHGEGSLSTLCSTSDGHLLEQLAQMGPKFDNAKELLEQLDQEDSDNDPT